MWKSSRIRALALAVSLLLAAGAPAQIKRETSANRKLGEHGLNGSTLFTGSVAAYFPGQETAVGNWATPGRNLLLQSENLATWTDAESPVKTATTIQDDNAAAFEHTYQTVSSSSGTYYIWKFKVLKDAVVPSTRFPYFEVVISGTYAIGLDTASGAIHEVAGLGGSTTVTDDGLYWLVNMSFTADDAFGSKLSIYPAGGANANLTTLTSSAVGTITVLQQQLTPGSTVRDYQPTTTKQTIPDWSGKGNTAYRGTNANVETSDGTWAVRSRNLLAPGSAADLTNAAWTMQNLASRTATRIVENSQDTYHLIETGWQVLPVGSTFAYSADITLGTRTWAYLRTGMTGSWIKVWFNLSSGVVGTEEAGLTGAISNNGDGSYRCTIYGIYATSSFVQFGLASADNTFTYEGDGSSYIDGTNFQLEQVPAGGVASPFTLPSNPVMMGWDADGVDDILTGAATLPANWAFTATIRPDAVATRGLFQNGTNGQKVSLDANGKVAYTNGVDTVTSTAAIPAGLWSIISVVNNGGTITHYLNGAANGSAAASGASNAFTALRFGTDGTTFYDGQLAAFVVYNTAKTAPQELAKATRMAVEFWNRRAFRTAITDVTNAPLYAWLEEVREILWARLLPVSGGAR